MHDPGSRAALTWADPSKWSCCRRNDGRSVGCMTRSCPRTFVGRAKPRPLPSGAGPRAPIVGRSSGTPPSLRRAWGRPRPARTPWYSPPAVLSTRLADPRIPHGRLPPASCRARTGSPCSASRPRPRAHHGRTASPSQTAQPSCQSSTPRPTTRRNARSLPVTTTRSTSAAEPDLAAPNRSSPATIGEVARASSPALAAPGDRARRVADQPRERAGVEQVVEVEGVDVDSRPHHGCGKSRRPLRGVAPRSRSTEGEMTHDTARSRERKAFTPVAAAQTVCRRCGSSARHTPPNGRARSAIVDAW